MKDAKSRYESLKTKRNTVEDKAEQFAKWTIPSVFPDTSVDDSETLSNSLNSIGAEALNNVSNKLLLALFSPSQPFFRVQLTEAAKVDLMNSLGIREEAEVDVLLTQVEKAAVDLLTEKGLREKLFELIQLLVCTGNALLEYRKDKPINIYSLRDYVVKRDSYSKVEELILKRSVTYGTLSDEQKSLLVNKSYKQDETVSFFYWAKKQPDNKYHVHQYLEDVQLTSDSDMGIYTEDNFPFRALTWRISRNRNYGTGLVEEYSGDFTALNVLTTSLTKGLAIAADLKRLVNPAGLTDIDELVDSEFGDYISGRAEDISSPSVGNTADFSAVLQGIDKHTQRIARAFLVNSAVTRDSERTTAYEIQQQIKELETSFGGVYTNLSSSLQRPLATLALQDVDGAWSKANGVRPVIVTGLEAISRYGEVNQVQMWLQDLAGLAQMPEAVLRALNVEDLGKFMGASRGVDVGKFVKSAEQVQQEMMAQQQQQQQMMAQQQMGEAVAQQVGGSRG